LAARGRTAGGGHRERQSTDVGHRGGTARSSGEGPVMGPERRGRADQGRAEANPEGEEPGQRPEPKVKSFEIDKRLIVEAWEKVRANNGAPGVDAVGIGLFAEQLRDNLYKLWNRMSSGSYFPGPVRGVEIPKDHGEGVRLLGVPNTADRVAQTAAAMLLEQKLEPVFHRDSYGYRPGGLKRRCRCPTGPLPRGRRELRRDPRFRRCWLTCSCITRSTRGWAGNSRAARLSATPTYAELGISPLMPSTGLCRPGCPMPWSEEGWPFPGRHNPAVPAALRGCRGT
jgi:hypothetical protein